MSKLADKRCLPCSGGVPRLSAAEIATLAPQVPEWEVVLGHHLRRVFTFPDFRSALAFTNRIGEVAEAEGHHPDLGLAWGRVEVQVSPHKAFILAAKVDARWRA